MGFYFLVFKCLFLSFVFKCFAKVSKPREEDLQPTGKAFQMLGPTTAKDLKPQSVQDDQEQQCLFDSLFIDASVTWRLGV